MGVMTGARRPGGGLSPLLGPRRHITIGLAGAAASMGLLSLLGAHSSLWWPRSEEHTSELQSRLHLVCRLLLEKKKKAPAYAVRPLPLSTQPSAARVVPLP